MNVINKVYSMKKKKNNTEENKSSYLLFNFKTDLYSFYSMEELKEYIKNLFFMYQKNRNRSHRLLKTCCNIWNGIINMTLL